VPGKSRRAAATAYGRRPKSTSDDDDDGLVAVLSKSDSNIAKCVVCLQIMTSWDSTKIPIYKLVQRPEE
jgi:hypothetical protein